MSADAFTEPIFGGISFARARRRPTKNELTESSWVVPYVMPTLSQIFLLFSVAFAADQEDTCERDGCSVEFLQRGLHVDQAKLQSQANRNIDVKRGFNCSSHPALCVEPFNCQTYDGPQGLDIGAAIAKNGRANLQSWCQEPQYHEFLSQCIVEKDLVKAGQIQYNNTKAGKHGPNTFQMDGSYCFIEGHCLNRAVHANTTLPEAEAQCNARFGHTAWTTFGDPQSPDTMTHANFMSTRHKLDLSKGFQDQESTRGFLLLACAMGNYHCDVMYCKETYCKDQEMIQKYSHFLDDLGWTKTTEEWFVGASK